MHPVNRFLRSFGVQLVRLNEPMKRPKAMIFQRQLEDAKNNKRGWRVFGTNIRDDSGEHPQGIEAYQCAFATSNIKLIRPEKILDVGSIRYWILGVLAQFSITTVDIRHRNALTDNEIVVTCDARNLDLPDESFDMVVSLYTLAHIGLGRYGDQFDLDGDLKAFEEMRRVLKKGGHLLFTVPLTPEDPFIYFNMRRYYDIKTIRGLCKGLNMKLEKFYSHYGRRYEDYDKIVFNRKDPIELQYNMYMGCWQKV